MGQTEMSRGYADIYIYIYIYTSIYLILTIVRWVFYTKYNKMMILIRIT